MSLKEAEAAYMAAQEAAGKAERAYETERDKRIRRATDEIDHDMREQRSEHLALCRARGFAEIAWKEARVEAARKKAHTLGPIGTVLIEWDSGRSYGYTSRREWRKTGRTGKLDVWTMDSAHPANMTWSLPSVGDFYVRVVKKDGSESRLFESLRGYSSDWFVEGKSPPGAKQ